MMQYQNLGTTSTKISRISLGTMTFGEQNTQDEAHQQLDMAFEFGINFIDTAELYPIPPNSKSYGDTERYISNWDKLKTSRDKLFLASKIAGPSTFTKYMRSGELKFDKINLETALDQTLKRLNTDYLDLYQLHWPERNTNYFGTRDFNGFIDNNEEFTSFNERLTILNEFVKKGKIKHFGVSNETPWGLLKYLTESIKTNQAGIQSVQNPYNLLNRTFEIGLAEICHREKISMLAYSPLAFGTLSGKYLNGKFPKGSRLEKFKSYNRYSNTNAVQATENYISLAKEYELDPSQMAISYLLHKNYVSSVIIGATNLQQLKINMNSIDVKLSRELIDKIDLIHSQNPNPSP